jgi:ketosteroid isomerase-like protein
MPEENVELVRRAIEALSEGGVEAMLPYVHEDFEMSTPPDLAAEPDTYRGHDGVRRWFDSFYEVMDRVGLEADDLVAADDDLVVAKLTIAARGGTTGIELTLDADVVCALADERIREIRFFGSRAEALAAAGS